MSRPGLEAGVLPSMGENTIVRLAADIIAALCGFLSAVVTARVLGPADKGTLSTLLFILALLSYAASLGLGDAAIVLVRRGEATIQQAFRSSLAPLLLTAFAAASLLFVIARVAEWGAITAPLFIGAAVIVLSTVSRLVIAIENARERLKMTSLVFAVNAVVTAGGVVVFVGVLDLGIAGAVLATLCGVASGVALTLWDMTSRGTSFGGTVSRSYLEKALRYGIPSEAAYILVALSQRVDLLVVYALLGESDAGLYAIALTLGQLVGYGPSALATVSFPRLAGLADADVAQLVERLSRVTLATALLAGLILAVAAPLVIIPVFGRPFADSMVPTLILLAANVLWSEQWLLARAAAARGDSRLYFFAFSSSLAAMVGLDLMLIPAFGITGAAIASTVAALGGLIVCLLLLKWREHWPLTVSHLIPTGSDVQELIAWLRQFVNRLRTKVASRSR